MALFHVRVAGDDLTFSASHFITFSDGRCERLHGHTYGVSASVHGPLNESQYVLDHQTVRAVLREILAELDHRVLLPAQHPTIQVTQQSGQVEVYAAGRRWSFPADECLLMPIANTTSESLAQYVGQRLLAVLASAGATPDRLVIELSEGTGASAACELP